MYGLLLAPRFAIQAMSCKLLYRFLFCSRLLTGKVSGLELSLSTLQTTLSLSAIGNTYLCIH